MAESGIEIQSFITDKATIKRIDQYDGTVLYHVKRIFVGVDHDDFYQKPTVGLKTVVRFGSYEECKLWLDIRNLKEVSYESLKDCGRQHFRFLRRDSYESSKLHNQRLSQCKS